MVQKTENRLILGVIFCCFLWMLFFTINPATADMMPSDYNHGLGPLDYRSSSPGKSIRLSMPILGPALIKPGWGINMIAGTNNVWLNEDEYLFDYELFDGHISVTYGFNEYFGIIGFIDHRYYWGGMMDGFIENAHDLLNIGQNGRDEWPRNKTYYILKDSDGEILYSSDSMNRDFENTGIGIGFNHILTNGDPQWLPAVSFGGILRYGVNGPRNSEKPLDFGLQIGLSKRLGDDWLIYGHVGYEQYNQNKFMMGDIEKTFKSSAFSGLISIAWNLKPNISIYLQYNIHEGVIKNLGSFKDPIHELNIGFKWQLNNTSVFQFGLVENIISMDNSNDLGLLFGYSINI
ncbi:MAG: DUF3187 family protein [Desulfobacteraceae bacterium]|nr:DUF3187 family protein [Desulfobacteraceae bacterium]